MNSEVRRGKDPAHGESIASEDIPADLSADQGTAREEREHLSCGDNSMAGRLNRSGRPVTDGGRDLPSRAAIAAAIRDAHADGLTHIKTRHIVARLDDYDRDQDGVAKSIGRTCSDFCEEGALEQWSAGRGGGRTVWEIVDVDALPAREAVADGGPECGRRDCDADETVSFTTERGSTRVRCPEHALADGVEGVGDTRAALLMDAFQLDELVELCDGYAGSVHSPVELSNLDGVGPRTASKLARNIDDSPVAYAVRGEIDVRADGGHAPDETVELRIRADRANIAGVISTYGIGVEHAPAFGPGEAILTSVRDGMEDVYPTERRMADLKHWIDNLGQPASPDVDVELVTVDDADAPDQDDSDDPDDWDEEATDIPIADGGAVEHPEEFQRTRTRADVLGDAVDTWGVDLQVDIAIEEFAELVTELARDQRGTGDPEDLVEELADAQIMLDQLALIIGPETVDTEVERKLDRLAERIDAATDGGHDAAETATRLRVAADEVEQRAVDGEGGDE